MMWNPLPAKAGNLSPRGSEMPDQATAHAADPNHADDLFADPDALWCGSGIPGGQGERGVGGVRISGRWPNVSGCEDAVWALLGMVVDGVFSFAVVPVADLAIERTWHMAGMCGTGSQTVAADDLLVPAERVATAASFTTADLMLYSMTVLSRWWARRWAHWTRSARCSPRTASRS